MTQTTLIRLNAGKSARNKHGSRRQIRQVLQPVYRFIAVLVGALAAVFLLWEGYKALGRTTGDTIPFTEIPLPVATDDYAMPHISSIIGALFEPVTGGQGETLLSYFVTELSVTLREAAYGLIIGAVIGIILAVLLREFISLERGVLPWLVMSQTIPLVALAPIIVVWAGAVGLPSWIAVTVISAYISFFPVVINTLSGLNSPDPVQVEAMRSMSATRLQVLWWLRFPAAIPGIFTGLRLAAISSVVGAIVGELSAGTGLGIGRAILTAAYYYSNSPVTLFGAVLIAALGGVVFVQIISLVEVVVLRKRKINA